MHGLTKPSTRKATSSKQNIVKRLEVGAVENSTFSNEKLSTLEQSQNSENDVVYALSIEDIPEKSRTRNARKWQQSRPSINSKNRENRKIGLPNDPHFRRISDRSIIRFEAFWKQGSTLLLTQVWTR